MRRLFVAGLALVFVLCAGAQDNTKADQILDEVSQKSRSFKNISAEFVFTMENKEMEINEKNEGSIKINGEKYVVSLPGIGLKVISDGTTVWNYMEDGNQVTITNQGNGNNELMDPSSIFTIYEKNFRSKYIGEKKTGNKILYQIELYPDNKEHDISKIALFINKESMMLDSAAFYGNDGNLYGIEVKQIETDLNLPDSFFVFDSGKYGDIEIIDFR
jgi:outer membrane lipoprotein-sorting protein